MAHRPSPRAKQAAARLAVPTVVPNERPASRAQAAVDRLNGIEHLDGSRPYGKVFGDFFVNGVRVAFEQSSGKGRPSKLFDHQYRRLYRDNEQRSAAPPSPRRREVDAPQTPPPAAVEGDEDDDHEEELPPMVTAPAPAPERAPVEGDDTDVNLTAWAERAVTYRWAAVRDAIEARYGRVVNDEAEARDFLQDEGLGNGSGRRPVNGG